MQAQTIQTDYDSGDSRWYALYTRHQHEKGVARALRAKGFEAFLPLYETAHRWKDRVKPVTVPLFPCYVFLRGGLQRRLDVLKTEGVHEFVSVANTPASIPSEEIEALRKSMANKMRLEPHPFLQHGDRVRVKRGALEGIEGILVRKKNLYRLVLSVEMLGKSAAVEVDATMIERIAPHGVVSFHSNTSVGVQTFR